MKPEAIAVPASLTPVAVLTSDRTERVASQVVAAR